MRKLIIAALSALPLMYAPSASADDFTFNVPIRIENAPGIVEADVHCGVTLRSARGGETYVQANQTIAITGGAYRGTITMTATVPTGARAADAINWNCRLTPGYRVATGVARATGDVEAWYEDVAGRSVASHTLTAFGYLPAR